MRSSPPRPFGLEIFVVSDLDEAEDAVLSAASDAALTQLYLNINIPVHSLFAGIYLVSLFLPLWAGRRDKKDNLEPKE